MRMIFVFFFVLCTMNAFAGIKEIHSFKEAERDLNNLEANSFVLFDIDEVLVSPADVVLKPVGGKFNPPSWSQLSPKQYDDFLSIMLGGTEYQLVDPTAPQVIRSLSERGIPTIGFTSCRTGVFGTIPSMEHWRIEQLKRVGIDFSASFTGETAFPHLVDPPLNAPLCRKGILFCGDFYDPQKSTKGKLIGIFLDRFNLKPKRIVFFDDEMKNLLVVQEEAEKRGIPFDGFLLLTDFPQLDEKIAELQFQTVLEQRKWISDQQAKQLLK